MLQIKFVEKIKTHFIFNNFFSPRKSCSLRDDVEKYGRARRATEDNTGLSKKMGGIWNRYNLKSTGRIYTFGVLKCSEEFKVLDLP